MGKFRATAALFLCLVTGSALTACQNLAIPGAPRAGGQASMGGGGAKHSAIATKKTYGPRVSQEVLERILLPHDILLLPKGRPGPFPVVVFVHGCGGLSPNEKDWSDWYLARGYAVYAVNSYKGRGWKQPEIREVCSAHRLSGTERTADLLVGLVEIKANPKIDPNRIIIMGWSHGGWTTLDLMALDPPRRRPPTLTHDIRERSGRPASLAGVRGVITLYPYCGPLSETQSLGLNARIPTLMLNAGSDRVVPHQACERLASRMAAQGYPIRAHTYPGAGHGYDVKGAQRVFRPADRADTEKRISAFLASLGML